MTGIRARARAEMLEQIKDAARAQLATEGAGLSLRAVARQLGVVSSAVYRYFSSREALLAALAADARDGLGAAVTTAEAAVGRRDLAGRWSACARAVRAWAAEHPHEFGLLFGVPVGGEKITPGSEIVEPLLVIARILADGASRGASASADRLAKPVRTELEAMGGGELVDVVAAGILARGLTAWAQLVGAVTLELSGRSALATSDPDAWFDHQVRAMGSYLGVIAR